MLIGVTGGTGLLGNNVIRAAIDAGHQVRALSRSSSPQPCFDDLSIDFVVGDVTDPTSVRDLLHGVDAVVHCAGRVAFGWTGVEQANAVNGTGAGNVAAAARKAGVRMVHVSTTNTLAVGRRSAPANEETVGNDQILSTYAVSKRLGDRLIQEQLELGLDAVLVHPGFMLGPWDWKPSSGELVIQLSKYWSPLVPMGGVCLCDVRDVANGVLLAIDRGKSRRSYILGGENWSHFQLWKTISAELGRRGPLSPIGPFGPRVLGTLVDAAVKFGMREPMVNGAALRVASQCHYYDSSRARQELGYVCRPGIESIQDSIAWFRQQGMIAQR